MSTIKVRKPKPEKHTLDISDLSGETWVVVRPPSPRELEERAQELSKRTPIVIEGYYHTQVEVNSDKLRHLEIWLTYESTNLQVEILDDDGQVGETVTFKPREETTREEFQSKLDKLAVPAYGILVEWQQKVRETVLQWDTPFW